ncbi:UNVERIFIED_CONTAM: hypothetical protein Slati_3676400 [Sesamum latifolium]|uniref:DUF4218 domain-containing protein n=1 Tax=Sesamum latifolium TaxID=2727402 RepID=A0AAW2U2F1_9LAMI
MKDNLNAQKDLKIICNRSELKVDERRPNMMPKAVYTLTKEQKMRICEWITHLKFSDSYTSNLARYVDMKKLRLHGMESHDCHVFIQKLILIVFPEMLPKPMQTALIEVNLLFQILCSMTLDINKVKNKAHVEASIVEAYLVEEISLFTSHYFEPQILCKWNRPRKNDDLTMNDTRIQQSIFNYPGRASGALKKRWHGGSEHHIIKTYILTNYEVVYYESFFNELYLHHYSQDPIIEELVATQLKDWFKLRVKSKLNYTNNELSELHYWSPTAEIMSSGTPLVPSGRGRGRGRGPPLPAAPFDASQVGEAVFRSPPPLVTAGASVAPQAPDDAGPSGAAPTVEEAGSLPHQWLLQHHQQSPNISPPVYQPR